jgi:NitT/TauT family transport system permease protein
MKSSFWTRIVPPLIPFGCVFAGLEILSRSGVVAPYLMPAPTAVVQTLWTDRAELWRGLLSTAAAASMGFALSVSAGILIAIVLSSSLWVRRAFYPYAVFFQTVPIIAIAPLLVIWFDYGTPVVVASTCIVSIFPVIANTLSGMLATDPNLRDLFRLYGAGPVATMWKLRLPWALPGILTGLRVASGLAVIGAIVGEFIGGTYRSLGGVIDAARTQQRTDKVFAAVLLASLLGLAMFGIINLVSWLALRRWHASEQT